MSIPIRRLIPLATVMAVALALVAHPAAAQRQLTLRADAADSVAAVVRRQPVDGANAALRTRDRHVALLLSDTTVVLQFTDRGLDHVRTQLSEEVQGTGGRMLARVLGAGLVELLDHGIAYRLSALRAAHADGNRLVLEDRDGHRVFAGTEANGRRVMDDFAPAEAERFAAAVNRAIRARP
jgi:hypothetical protein